MFVCHVCCKSESNTLKFRAHLQRHHTSGELTYPIFCRNCKNSYSTLYNFMRHVKRFHASLADNTEEHFSQSQNESSDCPGSSPSSANSVAAEEDVNNMYSNVRDEAVTLVAQLRANSAIPYSVIPSVVDSFNNMSESLTSVMQLETVSALQTAGICSDVIDSVKQHLDMKFCEINRPLDFLSTRYKQDSYFDNHPLAVNPESVVFGVETQSSGGASRLSYETFQYVSVQQTLKSLMQNRFYVEALLHDRCESDLLQDFADGDRYKTHPLFSDTSKFSLMIQLFYDGLGVTNPLRGHSSLHNVGVFFYSIRNLPLQYNSCLANIHLLALCYSQDLKKYGFNPVLEKFVSEVNTLSKVGFEQVCPVIGKCTIYASLCQVTCDNLALNGILGLIESFSCDYFCSICYATQDSIQVLFREDMFELRTVSTYCHDLHALYDSQSLGQRHVRGVKAACKLNEIDGFHVADNWTLDIMHVVLECIIPVELGCILHGLCVVDKCFDLQRVNKEIQLFWGKITIERTHKPLSFTRFVEPGQGLAPSMKAMQLWSLLKYLPLIFGHLILPDNKHWIFLLHLSHLVDLVFAPKFTQSMISYLRSVIEDHLAMFVQLYGNGGRVRLRPKHHLLVHLPTVISKCGPLIGMSCLKYELKNSFFKRSAHVVCNFSNICHTLAYRHQQRALFSLLSNASIRDVPSVTHHCIVQVCSLPYSELLCIKFAIEPTDDIAVAKKICIASAEYRQGQFVVITVRSDADQNPVFAKIVTFVSHSKSDCWFLVLETHELVEFNAHFHAYSVACVKPAIYSVVSFDELLDHHPLFCHCAVVQGVQHKFIRLPYHILGL